MDNNEFIVKVLSKTFWGSFVFLDGDGLNSRNFEGIFYNGEYVEDEEELELFRDWILKAMKSKAVESIEDSDAIWKRYPIEVLDSGETLDSSSMRDEATHDIFFVIFLNDSTWEIQIEEVDYTLDDMDLDYPKPQDDGIDMYVNPEDIDDGNGIDTDEDENDISDEDEDEDEYDQPK